MSRARHRRARPEDAIQRAVTQHYRQRAAAGVFMFAVPNGGYRRPIEAAIMKATGTVAGVPDTIWIKDGQAYALELKAEGGKPTPKQVETIAAMQMAGAIAAVAVGLNEALRWLEERGLLRGQAT
jgi:hypothetical protein